MVGCAHVGVAGLLGRACDGEQIGRRAGCLPLGRPELRRLRDDREHEPELNAKIAEIDLAEEDRVLHGQRVSVGFKFRAGRS